MPMIYQLFPDMLWFPDPREGEPDGLFAVGGDLSPQRLLLAYSQGIFPWYGFKEEDEPLWYCPMQRFVIFPDEIHISHSMRTLINKGTYHITFNKDFRGVIEGCSENRTEMEGAWLGDDMKAAYNRLHEMGYAMSVEVWHDDKLVGGLYGVTIAGVFCGESMFSRKPSASKLALIKLAEKMRSRGGRLIDCQLETPHLKSMGARFIPYEDYLDIIRRPDWI